MCPPTVTLSFIYCRHFHRAPHYYRYHGPSGHLSGHSNISLNLYHGWAWFPLFLHVLQLPITPQWVELKCTITSTHYSTLMLRPLNGHFHNSDGEVGVISCQTGYQSEKTVFKIKTFLSFDSTWKSNLDWLKMHHFSYNFCRKVKKSTTLFQPLLPFWSNLTP
jgi:hypothetical protein